MSILETLRKWSIRMKSDSEVMHNLRVALARKKEANTAVAAARLALDEADKVQHHAFLEVDKAYKAIAEAAQNG